MIGDTRKWSIEDNTRQYSKDWQEYKGEYDKFEYDIMTNDGYLHENCYPNAGKFNPMGTNLRIDECHVKLIRFSKFPKMDINYDEFYE